jgi:drug/metabolite transporter (DMT)-like permease
MPSGILLGLLAALCWGIADFCARGASRAAGTFRTLLVIQPLAILGLLLLGLPLGLLRLQADPDLVLAAAAINVLILGGAGLLYRAFAIGTLAVVSPIAAGFAAVTALLAMSSGERPSGPVLLGIALTIGGVVLTSVAPEQQPGAAAQRTKERGVRGESNSRWHLTPGLAEALGALVAFGVGYWLLRFVTPELGGATVALIGKCADLLVLGALAAALYLFRAGSKRARSAVYGSRGAGGRSSLRFWLFVVPTALLDTAANVAYNVGISTALTAVVVTLASLFSAVTVLLAWIFLRERLAVWQWGGVAAILAGITLVNL